MEVVRKGKRVYGAYVETATSKMYVAFRRPRDIFKDVTRGKDKSIGQALEDGSASWAIDDLQLREAKRRGCTYIGVWVKKLNWLFLTPIDNYFDPTLYYRRNYSSRGGSDQRYLPAKYFRQRNGVVKI